MIDSATDRRRQISISDLHVHDVVVRLEHSVAHLQRGLEADVRLDASQHGFLEAYCRVVKRQFLAEAPGFHLQCTRFFQGFHHRFLKALAGDFRALVEGLAHTNDGANRFQGSQ